MFFFIDAGKYHENVNVKRVDRQAETELILLLHEENQSIRRMKRESSEVCVLLHVDLQRSIRTLHTLAGRWRRAQISPTATLNQR